MPGRVKDTLTNAADIVEGITRETQWTNTAKQEERKNDCIKGKKGIWKTRTNGTWN